VEEQYYMDNIPYANMIGSMMHEIICNHPNIAYVVIVVSIFFVILKDLLTKF